MVMRRPLPEFGVEIMCDGRTLRVLDSRGNTVEEERVDAGTRAAISGHIRRMESRLIADASAMEAA